MAEPSSPPPSAPDGEDLHGWCCPTGETTQGRTHNLGCNVRLTAPPSARPAEQTGSILALADAGLMDFPGARTRPEFSWERAYRELSAYLHRRDEHNQYIERCESLFCNPIGAPLRKLAAPASTEGEEKMPMKVVCKCGEELRPCTDGTPSSIPCKGWVHSVSNSHVCLSGSDPIAEPHRASAPDAGQPTVTLRTDLTEPFDKLVDHLQDCCGGCPYCVDLCKQVVWEGDAIQERHNRNSAAASAARDSAAWEFCERYLLNGAAHLHETTKPDYGGPMRLDDALRMFAAEQTRQLHSENSELQKQVDAADRWSLDTEQLRDRIKEEVQRAQIAEAERDKWKRIADIEINSVGRKREEEITKLQAELERLRKEANGK